MPPIYLPCARSSKAIMANDIWMERQINKLSNDTSWQMKTHAQMNIIDHSLVVLLFLKGVCVDQLVAIITNALWFWDSAPPWTYNHSFLQRIVGPRGGGGHSALIWTEGGGVPLGGRKPDPISNRSAHKKYTLSQYTLLKRTLDGLSNPLCIIIHSYKSVASRMLRRWCRDCRPVINIMVPHAPLLVLRSWACHEHGGLRTRRETREATLW